jgi:hypothetical protein
MKSGGVILHALLAFAGLAAAQLCGAAGAADANTLLQGRFDNREQVAKAKPGAQDLVPHVTVTIEPTPQDGWSLWHVHLEADAENAFDQNWAMQAQLEHDGSTSLVPYYQFKPAGPATAATFDPKTWLSLEACALRGKFDKTHIKGMSEGEPCAAVTMSIGPLRALLPVGIDREGEWLHLDLNYRGVCTRIDARRVQ